MPFDTGGVFVESVDEAAYEAEVCYYLNYHVKSAVISIDKIVAERIKFQPFDSKAQYLHFYSDHLMFSLGQIVNRFFNNKNYQVRVNTNRSLFAFSKNEYPVLCNIDMKDIRDAVEHLEEYNIETIKNKRGVGGFNTIDKFSSIELVEALKKHDDSHIYTLDRINNVIYVKKGKKRIYLDLNMLKADLEKLLKRIEYVNEMRTFI